MSETTSRKEAARKRAAALKAKDPDYFKKLAARVRRRGRSASAPAGFAADPARARVAGSKGGKARARSRALAEGSEGEAPVRTTEAKKTRPASEG